MVRSVYGDDEWLDQKRGIRSPLRWRKLHLGVNADTHEVVAAELTQDDGSDVSEFVGFLDQVATRVASVIADGAYDGVRVGRRSAISILQRSKDMVASAGSIVLATTGGASLRPRCIGTKPSLTGVYTLGFCPVSGSKQRLDATRRTGWQALDASHHPDRLMLPPAGTRPAAQYSRNKAAPHGSHRRMSLARRGFPRDKEHPLQPAFTKRLAEHAEGKKRDQHQQHDQAASERLL